MFLGSGENSFTGTKWDQNTHHSDVKVKLSEALVFK
jgi:hypothetical protein